MAETAAPETKTRLEKIPINFQLDDKLIDGATIRPSTFASFADCIGAAHKMTQPAAFSARLLRVRMSRQVSYHMNGAVVQITPTAGRLSGRGARLQRLFREAGGLGARRKRAPRAEAGAVAPRAEAGAITLRPATSGGSGG